jgi:hypothetical protein
MELISSLRYAAQKKKEEEEEAARTAAAEAARTHDKGEPPAEAVEATSTADNPNTDSD